MSIRAPGAARAIAFVARCTGGAVAAAALANAFHLSHPVWASVSALVVSQDQLGETQRSVLWRVAATLTGFVVALAVAAMVPADLPEARLAAGVALAAAITRWRNELRVSMWTTVIVLLTVPPGGTIASTVIERGREVMLGVAVGAALHYLAERVLVRRA